MSCVAKLTELGFNGFVFDGTPGWLTVVPFGGVVGLFAFTDWIEQLSVQLGEPVLMYTCAADFFWAIQVWLPDGRFTSFSASVPDATGASEEPGEPLDDAVLATIGPVERIRKFLVPIAERAGDASKPARAFAEVIGLGHYRFLSPSYVTEDPDSAVQQGGRQIGVLPRPEDML